MEIYLVMCEQASPTNERSVTTVDAAFTDAAKAEEFAAKEQAAHWIHTTYYVDSVWVNGLS